MFYCLLPNIHNRLKREFQEIYKYMMKMKKKKSEFIREMRKQKEECKLQDFIHLPEA